MQHSLKPKLFSVIKTYDRNQFTSDLVAGIIVGIIAIPLSLALAISSGVSPEIGLYTAAVAGLVISILGGSRVQIGGPTAAFVPVVYGIVQQYGTAGLTLASIMAGIFLIIMGVCRLGSMIKYIPFPIVTGFTSGIAVSILVKQFRDLFGFSMKSVPAEFPELCAAYVKAIPTTHIPTVCVGASALAIIILWARIPGKISRMLPGSLLAILVTTMAVNVFSIEGIETIGSRFGNITGGFPPFTLLQKIDFHIIQNLIGPALGIAILAGIESLLSAVVADGMIGGHHRSNAELLGQGAANIASAFFGGIPATGAIARTAANIRNGGRTPVAGIIHALVVLAVLLLFMPLAKMIPLATLAAILVMVAVHMGEWQAFRDLARAPRGDSAVLVLTFLLTIVFDLVVAIETGMVLAAFLFMKRMSDVTEVKLLTDESDSDNLDENDIRQSLRSRHGEKVMLYEINGPFFFGAADKFMTIAGNMRLSTRAVIIKLDAVSSIDGTGLHFLATFLKTCQNSGIYLYLTGVQPQSLEILKKSGLLEHLGEDQVCRTLEEAVSHYESQPETE